MRSKEVSLSQLFTGLFKIIKKILLNAYVLDVLAHFTQAYLL